MTTTRTYLVKRTLAIGIASFVCLVTSAVAVDAARQTGSPQGCAGAFAWPVKPFDRPHQIRGAFGDPRTQFDGPPTLDTLLTGDGSFSFQGVDITAPDGAAVYAVASGTVTRVTPEWVAVDCGNGRSFEYWHINSRVRVGQKVDAGRTVIGFIKPSEAHVHLTQREDGRVVNPATPGRLAPHEDTTIPEILHVGIRRDERGQDELPQLIRGRVQLVVEAVDFAENITTPGLRTPGLYRNWPVTPARLTWRIERWTGRVVVPNRVARDVRRSVPRNDDFWRSFVRGTSQNQSVFGSHYSYLQPGRYLFRLTPSPFDTRTLHDGVYDLVVSAGDVAGHRDVSRLRFTVANHAEA